MSSYYGVIFPEFWTGRTGRELRTLGGRDAQLLGLYLASNRHANMLGLYRLFLDDVQHEIGLSRKAIERAYAVTHEVEYASFDAVTSFVWVRQMVRFRLNLHPGESLSPGDKRVTAVNRMYQALDVNPFLGTFFDTYRTMLHLDKKRKGQGRSAGGGDVGTVSPSEGASHGALDGPSKGHSKPLGSQITDISNQRSEELRAVAARRGRPVEQPSENLAVITRLVHEAIDGGERHYPDIKAAVKDRCGALRIAYDADVVGKAVESALAQRKAVSA